MREYICNLVSILMKADLLALLNITVTDHGYRSYNNLGSGLSLLPQETDYQLYIYTLEAYCKVPLGSVPMTE